MHGHGAARAAPRCGRDGGAMVIPASMAGDIDEIPLYDHDKGEYLDLNDQDEYEE